MARPRKDENQEQQTSMSSLPSFKAYGISVNSEKTYSVDEVQYTVDGEVSSVTSVYTTPYRDDAMNRLKIETMRRL